MQVQVLAYTSLDSLLTVELAVSHIGPDGVDTPVAFMGRSTRHIEIDGVSDVGERVFQISQLLADMAQDLA